jgi:ankyrin repeat protein
MSLLTTAICVQNGLNALHLAAKDGHLDIVADLLKRGATVDAATKKGNTALHIASLGKPRLRHLIFNLVTELHVYV